MSNKANTHTMKNEGKTALAPKLRFPEFQFSPEWYEEKLGNLASILLERAGERACIPMSITSGVGLVSQQEKYGRTIAGNSYKNYLVLERGDFAYNKSATKEFPQGFIARYTGDEVAAVPNSIFTCFRVIDDFPDGKYLNYLFSVNLHGKWLRQLITVGARAHGSLNINDDDILGIPVPLPGGDTSGAEQQKIAACLASLDELIGFEKERLEALKTSKKGLMQQLFPREGEREPRLRFPEFRGSGEWEEKQLENLAQRGSGHTPRKTITEYYNGGINWVSLADSKRLDRGLILDTEIKISAQGIENSSAVLHSAGSVLISRDADVGKSAVMSTQMAVSQHFIVWTCDNRHLFNWFLYYLLQKMKPLFERMATGSTIKTIGLPFFKDLVVSIPLLPEQQRIAACLSSLDDLISAQSDKLEALKAHKQGLMQQLFPSMSAAEA